MQRREEKRTMCPPEKWGRILDCENRRAGGRRIASPDGNGALGQSRGIRENPIGKKRKSRSRRGPRGSAEEEEPAALACRPRKTEQAGRGGFPH